MFSQQVRAVPAVLSGQAGGLAILYRGLRPLASQGEKGLGPSLADQHRSMRGCCCSHPWQRLHLVGRLTVVNLSEPIIVL